MSGATVRPRLAAHAVARVYDYYSMVDRGEFSSLVTLFAEDAVYHRPGYALIEGHANLERFYASERSIEVGTHTVLDVLAEADGVAVRGTFTGRLKDGRVVDLKFADFFTVNSDLLFSRRDTFFFTPLV